MHTLFAKYTKKQCQLSDYQSLLCHVVGTTNMYEYLHNVY